MSDGGSVRRDRPGLGRAVATWVGFAVGVVLLVRLTAEAVDPDVPRIDASRHGRTS